MITNLTKHCLRFFVIPNCTFEKAKFLARFRQISISSLIQELINEAFRNRKIKRKIEIADKELSVQLRLPFAQFEKS